MKLDGASLLITGGTGSFGKRFVSRVLQSSKPERLMVYSRDELKQFQMRQRLPLDRAPNLRMLIGDVRDRERLYRVMDGVDIVVHAAAMKQVPIAEYNPLEAIKTNVMGAANLIDAAIDRKVGRVVALSTDKAANPVNLYGASKLCADKLFMAANAAGLYETRFSVVRYGNIVGSRGSVIPYFLAQRPSGRITITDERMTRFLMRLDDGVDFVLRCIEVMQGGELFVPKIPSVRVADLARVIAPQCEREVIGIRPGEKLHEILIPADEAHLTVELEDSYIVQTSHSSRHGNARLDVGNGKPCPDGFSYSSHTNPWQLGDEEIAEMVAEVEADPDLAGLPMPTEPHFIMGG